MKSKIATLLIGAVVLGGGAVAYAQTQPADPSAGTGSATRPDRAEARACLKAHRENPDAEPSAACQALRERMKSGPRGGGEHSFLRRGIHGEILVKDGDGYSTVIFDRGRVTSASSGSITLERPDGQSVTVSTDDATVYRGISGFDEVRTGDPALVVTKGGRATLVAQRPVDSTEGEVPPGVISFDGNAEDSLIVL